MDVNSMLESDTNFRAQFDPNNPLHHKGDTTKVPMGGSRVPESMKDHEDWKSLPEQAPESKEDYGPEYDAAMKLRTDLEKFKKALAAVNPPLDGILKIRTQIAAATDETQKTKLKALLDKEFVKRDAALKALKDLESTFSGTEYDKHDAIEEVVTGALQEMTQESQSDYMLRTRRHSQIVFSQQKALLDKIKQLKKK